jgi:hypothetical protein
MPDAGGCRSVGPSCPSSCVTRHAPSRVRQAPDARRQTCARTCHTAHHVQRDRPSAHLGAVRVIGNCSLWHVALAPGVSAGIGIRPGRQWPPTMMGCCPTRCCVSCVVAAAVAAVWWLLLLLLLWLLPAAASFQYFSVLACSHLCLAEAESGNQAERGKQASCHSTEHRGPRTGRPREAAAEAETGDVQTNVDAA